MAIPASTFQSSVFFPGGSWSAGAWLNYWSAVWSVPEQPGYATLVRDGLAAMLELTNSMLRAADDLGASVATERAELVEIDNALRNVWLPLAASLDAPEIDTVVAQPLLTDPTRPLMRIGVLMGVMEKARPLRGWLDIFHDEIVTPTKRAAKAIGAVATSPVPWVAIGIAAAAWLVWRAR